MGRSGSGLAHFVLRPRGIAGRHQALLFLSLSLISRLGSLPRGVIGRDVGRAEGRGLGDAERLARLGVGLPPGGLLLLVVDESPDVAKEEVKEFVVFDGGTDEVVIIQELFARHLLIPGAVVHLKGVQELPQRLVLRFLTSPHVRVAFGVVKSFDSRHIDLSGAGAVDLREGQLREVLPTAGEGSADALQELVIPDPAALVPVQAAHERSQTDFIEFETIVTEDFGEVLQVQGSGVAVVHQLQAACEPLT